MQLLIKKIAEKSYYVIKKYNLNQEDIFRYSIIEELENCYIIATYKNYQVTVNKYPKTS